MIDCRTDYPPEIPIEGEVPRKLPVGFTFLVVTSVLWQELAGLNKASQRHLYPDLDPAVALARSSNLLAGITTKQKHPPAAHGVQHPDRVPPFEDSPRDRA